MSKVIENQTGRDGYLLALIRQDQHSDLEGQPAGVISAEAKATAQKRIEASQQRQQAEAEKHKTLKAELKRLRAAKEQRRRLYEARKATKQRRREEHERRVAEAAERKKRRRSAVRTRPQNRSLWSNGTETFLIIGSEMTALRRRFNRVRTNATSKRKSYMSFAKMADNLRLNISTVGQGVTSCDVISRSAPSWSGLQTRFAENRQIESVEQLGWISFLIAGTKGMDSSK